MVEDPINGFLTFFGILFCPVLTLSVILWQLNYQGLAIIAFLFASTTYVRKIVKKKTITKERVIDSRTGEIVSEHTTSIED